MSDAYRERVKNLLHEAMQLTPEQIAEIERRLNDDEPYATSEEVRDLYARLAR